MSFNEYKGVLVKNNARRPGGVALTNNFKTIIDKIELIPDFDYVRVANSVERLALTSIETGTYVLQEDTLIMYLLCGANPSIANNWQNIGLNTVGLTQIYTASDVEVTIDWSSYFTTSETVNFYYDGYNTYVDYPERLTAFTVTSAGANQGTLDLTACVNLTTITLTTCVLFYNLILNNSTSLQTVSINSNAGAASSVIKSIDLSGCSALTSFYMDNGQSTFETLNVTGCTALTSINIERSKILTLTGINSCSNLVTFYLKNDCNIRIASIDLSGLSNLEEIILENTAATISGLQTLNVTGCGSLTNMVTNYLRYLNSIVGLTDTNLNHFDFTHSNFINNSTLNFSNLTNLETVYMNSSNAENLLNFNFTGCTGLLSIGLNVEKTGGYGLGNIVGLNTCVNLQYADLNSLSSQSLTFVSDSLLSLTLHGALSALNISACPALNGVYLENNAITNIDDIINAINPLLTYGYLRLDGGTNAYRTSASNVNYNALIANGWSITVNIHPLEISGLYARWDAESLGANHNDVISTWTDSSVNGRDLTSPAGGVYKTDQNFNGKAVVRFNGNTVDESYPTYTQGNYYYNAGLNLSQPFTVFIVYSLDDILHETTFIGSYGGNKWYSSLTVYPPNTGTHELLSRSHIGTEYLADDVVGASKQVVTFVVNNSTGQIRVNSNVPYWHGAGAGTDGAFTGMLLGAYSGYYNSNGIGNFMAGYVADVIVYSRQLDNNELIAVETFLKSRYGIS